MASIGYANALILVGAALAVLGVFSSLVASRIGAPLLLVFLVVGLLAGEEGPGGIQFNDFYSTYIVGSAALAIVLFDGGLRTRFAAFRGAFYPAISLASVGVILTAILVGVLASFLLKLSWLEGLLIGAIVASTDAAAVFFLLRAGGQQLKRRVGATLEMESGTNDPIAVFMTILLVQIILASGQISVGAVALAVAREAILGTVLGVGGGFAISLALNRISLPSGLHPLLVVASALFIYALTAVIGGSGFLAVYLAGIVLGNRPVRAFASITTFHDTLTWLCQIAMFIMLGPAGHTLEAHSLSRRSARNLVLSYFHRAPYRGLALPGAVRFSGFGKNLHFLGWPPRRGFDIPRRDPDAFRRAQCRSLFQRCLRRGCRLIDRAGLVAHGGGPQAWCRARRSRARGEAYRNRFARTVG